MVVLKVLDELFHLAAPWSGLHSLEADQPAVVYTLAALHEAAHIEADALLRPVLYLRQLKDIAVQSLAELTVLNEYLYVLVVPCEHSCGIVHNVGIVAEKHGSVDVVEHGGGLSVDQRVVLDAVSEYLPCSQPVNICAEVLAYLLHVLSADLFAQLLYPVGKLLVVIEHLSRGIYLHFFEGLRAALSVSLELRY